MGFVFHDSFLETTLELEKQDKDMAYEYIKAIANYGLYGEMYDGKYPIIKALLITPQASIDAANNRYVKAIENGKKGGRPRKIDYGEVARLHKEGKTQKDIAAELNCSEDSVRRILKKQDEYAEEQKNQKNLTNTITKTNTKTHTNTQTLTNTDIYF